MLDLRRVDYLCYAWAIGKPWLGRLLSSRCHCRSLSLWSVGWCAENASPDGRAWKYAHFISRVYINQQNVHFEYFRWKPHISTLKFMVSVIFWHHFFFRKFDPGHTKKNTSPWRNWTIESPGGTQKTLPLCTSCERKETSCGSQRVTRPIHG